MKFHWIGRRDPRQRMLRLFSVLWGRAYTGHTHRLSVSLRPALLAFHREWGAWFLTIAGIRLHMKRDPAGGLV